MTFVAFERTIVLRKARPHCHRFSFDIDIKFPVDSFVEWKNLTSRSSYCSRSPCSACLFSLRLGIDTR